jgi:hypothetical protein
VRARMGARDQGKAMIAEVISDECDGGRHVGCMCVTV